MIVRLQHIMNIEDGLTEYLLEKYLKLLRENEHSRGRYKFKFLIIYFIMNAYFCL